MQTMKRTSLNFAGQLILMPSMKGNVKSFLSVHCSVGPFLIVVNFVRSLTGEHIRKKKRTRTDLKLEQRRSSRVSSTATSVGGIPVVSSSAASSFVNTNNGRRSVQLSAGVSALLDEDDIRIHLSNIFVHGYNTYDSGSLLEMLQTYCTADLICVYKYVGIASPYGPMYIELLGMEAVINYWNHVFIAIPDSVFELHETKLRILPNGCCAISSNFIFTGTKILEITPDSHESVVYGDSNHKSMQHRSSDSVSSTSTTCSTTSCDTHIDGPEGIGISEIREMSLALSIIGTVTYFTNANKKIYKIEYVHCMRT